MTDPFGEGSRNPAKNVSKPYTIIINITCKHDIIDAKSIMKFNYYYYYYYLESACKSENTISPKTLSVQVRVHSCTRTESACKSENTISPKTPTPHGRKKKKKTEGDKKERADHSNRKALALLLKQKTIENENDPPSPNRRVTSCD